MGYSEMFFYYRRSVAANKRPLGKVSGMMNRYARSAVQLSGKSPAIERREYRSQESLQQRRFRPGTCQHSNAEQDRQQKAREVFSRLRG